MPTSFRALTISDCTIFLPIRRILSALLFCSMATHADIKADLGYTSLVSLLGAATPDGTGVAVMQVEAGTNFAPDLSNAQFAGKTITDFSAGPSPSISSHATGVGTRFYGNTLSLTPAVDDIGIYSVNAFIFEYLNFNNLPRAAPDVVNRRVGNHSYVGGNFEDINGDPVPSATSNVLRRLDWLISEDEFIHIAAPNNGVSVQDLPLSTAAFNVITVGRSDALHLTSVSSLDTVYIANRAAIHLVVPEVFSSTAAPYGASAASLLVNAADANPLWSDGNTTNRAGALINNAGRSEVIKASLMAGASRLTVNSVFAGDVRDYRVDGINQTVNGLDVRYGAGQVNVFNAYNILSAGEQSSNQDGAAGIAGYSGFDYDPNFGGSSGSNSTAEYDLGTASGNQFFAASLVWNLDVTGPSWPSAFNDTAIRRNFDLELIDTTGGSSIVVASSLSSVDNTENIWLELVAGRDYRLRVTRPGGNINWDYGLAWHAQDFADSDSDGAFDHLDVDPGDPCIPLVFVSACPTDSDSDGISDYMEGEFLDSDGDGILDYLESNIVDDDSDGLFNHQDSAIADADGDGAVDQQDIMNNNPCLPDESMCDVEIPMLGGMAQSLLLLMLLALAAVGLQSRRLERL